MRNDSYLAVIALKLKEVFDLDYNDLAVLLGLEVKGISPGPALPAFLSTNVARVLMDNFDSEPTGRMEGDIAAMMTGQ